MGKLKMSPNLFLEVNELNRMTKFIGEDGYKLIIRNLIKNFGIAQNADNSYFKVTRKQGVTNTVTVNAGIAFDSDLNIIKLKENKDVTLTPPAESGIKSWIIISYSTSNDEEGAVGISIQGTMSGTGTKFLDVLRGQPNFPVKVRFPYSSKNTEEYEVVSVTSNTTATLAGAFVAESNLKYQVIGTFTPGFQPNDADKAIYEYDSCEISVVDSKDEPTVDANSFIIASVDFLSGGIDVVDERAKNLLNYEYKENNETTTEENPFVALRKTSIVNGNMLDIQFEWGYRVDRYELLTTSNSNIFNIVSGGSKYISGTGIPNNLFNGWAIVNRKNMVSVVIDYNVNKNCYISKYNPSLITGENDEFVIVPNFDNIEVEASLRGTNYADDDTNYLFIFSLENLKSRMTIPIEYLDTEVKLKYRLYDKDNTTAFHNFAVTQFNNVVGEPETLGDSSFVINVPEPEEVKRNYS